MREDDTPIPKEIYEALAPLLDVGEKITNRIAMLYGEDLDAKSILKEGLPKAGVVPLKVLGSNLRRNVEKAKKSRGLDWILYMKSVIDDIDSIHSIITTWFKWNIDDELADYMDEAIKVICKAVYGKCEIKNHIPHGPDGKPVDLKNPLWLYYSLYEILRDM